jgi:hypothetical protein
MKSLASTYPKHVSNVMTKRKKSDKNVDISKLSRAESIMAQPEKTNKPEVQKMLAILQIVLSIEVGNTKFHAARWIAPNITLPISSPQKTEVVEEVASK